MCAFVCNSKKVLKPAVCWDAMDAEEKRRFRTFARNLCAALAAEKPRKVAEIKKPAVA